MKKDKINIIVKLDTDIYKVLRYMCDKSGDSESETIETAIKTLCILCFEGSELKERLIEAVLKNE